MTQAQLKQAEAVRHTDEAEKLRRQITPTMKTVTSTNMR